MCNITKVTWTASATSGGKKKGHFRLKRLFLTFWYEAWWPVHQTRHPQGVWLLLQPSRWEETCVWVRRCFSMSKAQRHHFTCEALLKAQGTADPKHALCLQGPHHCHIYILYPWKYDQKFIQNPVAALSRTPPLTGTGKKQDGRREHKKYGYS